MEAAPDDPGQHVAALLPYRKKEPARVVGRDVGRLAERVGHARQVAVGPGIGGGVAGAVERAVDGQEQPGRIPRVGPGARLAVGAVGHGLGRGVGLGPGQYPAGGIVGEGRLQPRFSHPPGPMSATASASLNE